MAFPAFPQPPPVQQHRVPPTNVSSVLTTNEARRSRKSGRDPETQMSGQGDAQGVQEETSLSESSSQTETCTNSFDGHQGARNAHQEHMSVRTKTVTCASLDAELLVSGSDWGVWDKAYYATYFALNIAS